MNSINKKELSEMDIRTKFITPAITNAGWDSITQMREEYKVTNGRIIARGKSCKREAPLKADYVLFYKPNKPIAIVEAKDNKHTMADGMQQALQYASMMNVPFVFSSNGDGFVFHNKYVPVRMTKSEKDKFLRLSALRRAPEKTVLYWLINDMIVNEKPPEIFHKITMLLLRLQTNIDHIRLGRSNLSEKTKHKYHRFSKELNDCDCEITFKGLFADAHYGENRK